MMPSTQKDRRLGSLSHATRLTRIIRQLNIYQFIGSSAAREKEPKLLIVTES